MNFDNEKLLKIAYSLVDEDVLKDADSTSDDCIVAHGDDIALVIGFEETAPDAPHPGFTYSEYSLPEFDTKDWDAGYITTGGWTVGEDPAAEAREFLTDWASRNINQDN